MGAVVARPRTSPSAYGVSYDYPRSAWGEEGERVDRVSESAWAWWRGPSAYVRALRGGSTEPLTMNTSLWWAGGLAVVSVGLILAGAFYGVGSFAYPVAFFSGLAAYGLSAAWLAEHGGNEGFLGFLNRIRSIVAYEGDPAAAKPSERR